MSKSMQRWQAFSNKLLLTRLFERSASCCCNKVEGKSTNFFISLLFYGLYEIALTSLHPPRPYATCSHMHTAPSPRPRASHSGVLLSASWQFSTCTKQEYIARSPPLNTFVWQGRLQMVQGQVADPCCAYELQRPLQSVTHTFFSRDIRIDIRAARPAADDAWASCPTGRVRPHTLVA
jgi:hypothetical protein